MSVPCRMPLKTPRSKSAMRDPGTNMLSQGWGTRHSPILSSATSLLCTRSRNATYATSRTNANPGSNLSPSSTDLSTCGTPGTIRTRTGNSVHRSIHGEAIGR